MISMVLSSLCCCHSSSKLLLSFVSTEENLLHLKWSSDRPITIAKRFLKLINVLILLNQKSIISQELGSWNFWPIANSALNKVKSAIPPLYITPEVLSSAFDKAKLFARNFYNNSNLDDWGISLPALPCRTNLKLHTISVTPKYVKKVITNLDSSKVSGSDLCFSGSSEYLWSWTSIQISWTFQYVAQGIFFSRLLEGLICASLIESVYI